MSSEETLFDIPDYLLPLSLEKAEECNERGAFRMSTSESLPIVKINPRTLSPSEGISPRIKKTFEGPTCRTKKPQNETHARVTSRLEVGLSSVLN